jgi:hypothetical protein
LDSASVAEEAPLSQLFGLTPAFPHSWPSFAPPPTPLSLPSPTPSPTPSDKSHADTSRGPSTSGPPSSSSASASSASRGTRINSTDAFHKEFRDLPFHIAVERLQHYARDAQNEYAALKSKVGQEGGLGIQSVFASTGCGALKRKKRKEAADRSQHLSRMP